MSVDDFDHQHKPLIALVVVSCHTVTLARVASTFGERESG